MRHVVFDPEALPNDTDRRWWDRWKKRAAKARLAISKRDPASRSESFNSNIWSDLKKQFILDKVFYGYCAYCESPIRGISHGEAEHYRPKAAVSVRMVRDKFGTEKTVECTGGPHTGYYWLAYEWDNLLPACQECNGGEGKMTQFPVRKEHQCDDGRQLGSNDLDAIEEPLLLHPYKHKPSEHIVFALDGMVSAMTDVGEWSIAVYNLNRKALRDYRFEAQEAAWLRFRDAWDKGHVREYLQRLTEGRTAYSAACYDYVKQKWKLERQVIDSSFSSGAPVAAEAMEPAGVTS